VTTPRKVVPSTKWGGSCWDSAQIKEPRAPPPAAPSSVFSCGSAACCRSVWLPQWLRADSFGPYSPGFDRSGRLWLAALPIVGGLHRRHASVRIGSLLLRCSSFPGLQSAIRVDLLRSFLALPRSHCLAFPCVPSLLFGRTRNPLPADSRGPSFGVVWAPDRNIAGHRPSLKLGSQLLLPELPEVRKGNPPTGRCAREGYRE
jgi:hypothetical protein